MNLADIIAKAGKPAVTVAPVTTAKSEPAATAPEPAAPAVPDIKALAAKRRSILFGTGMTKKLAAKQASADRTREKIEMAAAAQHAAEAELLGVDTDEAPAGPVLPPSFEFEVLDDANLPDNLMSAGLAPSPDQTAALELSNQQYGCLIGPAGSGKTTTTKWVINEAIQRIALQRFDIVWTPGEPLPFDICFAAPTGIATQNLKRALPKAFHASCDTLHGTIEYAPEYEDIWDADLGAMRTRRIFRPRRTSVNPLTCRLLIIDEAGNTPTALWNNVWDALPSNCQVIFVGDINQLPPVGGKSILGHAMQVWPTFQLTQIHRTAADSPVIHNAHRVLNGKMPENLPNRGFFLQAIPDGSTAAMTTVLSAIKQLHKAGQFDPMQDGCIVAQNVKNLGQEALNSHIVHYFNPPRKVDGIVINPRTHIKAGGNNIAFAIGDKVMMLANQRDIGLTNGMMGVVTNISRNLAYKGDAVISEIQTQAVTELCLLSLANNIAEAKSNGADNTDDTDPDATLRQASHIMTVKFRNVDEEVTFATSGAFRDVTLAYVFTAHKAQGSEFRNIIVVCHASQSVMLCREWLYTALTRTKEKVFLLYNGRGLTQAVNRQRIKGRTLAEKAQSFLAGSEDTTQPELPDARAVERATEQTVDLTFE